MYPRFLRITIGFFVEEIQRFNDFIKSEDDKWRADPIAANKKFDAVFNRFAIRAIAAVTIAAITMAVWSAV